MIQTLVNCFIKVILMIALGYTARKINIIDENSTNRLSGLLIKVLLPCSILASSASSFDASQGKEIKFCVLLGFGFYVISLAISFVLFRVLPIAKEKKGVATTSTVFGNTGFIGYPLASELNSSIGLNTALAYDIFFNPLIYTVGIKLFSSEKMGFKKLLKLLASPVFIAVVVSNVMTFSGLKFPTLAYDFLKTVGNSTTPLSMIIIGSGFVNTNIKELFKDKYVYLVCLLKLIVYPLAVLLIFNALGISYEVKLICIAMSALPVGSFNVILPREYGGDVQFANKALLLSTILSLITIPLIMLVV